MDYSFYGGRPGQSMVVVKYFSSVEEMNTAFNTKGGYTEVGYGECVLINTTDSRNLENGRLYKRGLDGAEYLGTIKGPAGYPPHMELTDYDLISKPSVSGWGEDYYYADGKFSFKGDETNAQDLIPGKTGEGDNKSYTDDISWKTLSVRKKIYKWIEKENNTLMKIVEGDPSIKSIDEGTNTIVLQIDGIDKTIIYDASLSEEESVVQIGFKIPYHVFDWEAESITPYEKDYRPSLEFDKNSYVFTGDIEYTKLITDADIKNGEKQHPFYSDLKIKIPQGVKGDSIKGLRIIKKEEYFQLKEDSEAHLDGKHDLYENDYAGSTEDKDDSLILVYEYYDYRNNKDGDKITKYLGDYNMISNIEIDDYGTLTIHYTHENSKLFKYCIKWITDVSLDNDTGCFTLTYNTPLGITEEEKDNNLTKEIFETYRTNLTWVKDVKLKEGILTVTFTQKDGIENATYSETLDWIQNISIAQNGEITLTHSYRESEAPNNFKQTILDNKLQWVEDIVVNNKGDLITTYNVTDDSGKKATSTTEGRVKWIESIRIDKENNYDLLVTDNQGVVKNLGSVKVDETLSVAFNIDPDESYSSEDGAVIQAGNTIAQNLAFLNKKYPQGLSSNADEEDVNLKWMKGKIVTIGPIDHDNEETRKNFYAFDYNKSEWYYLGRLDGLGALKYQRVAENNPDSINSAMEALEIGGVCFITSDYPAPVVATLDYILEDEIDE